MDKTQISENVLKNCYKNAQMALVSLDDVIEKANDKLKEELIEEREGYEKHITEVSLVANKHNIPLPDINGMKKTMVGATIEMKTMADDSNSHIAEMTLKGTLMGITELLKDLSHYGHLLDSDIENVLSDLKDFEESCEKTLKTFI